MASSLPPFPPFNVEDDPTATGQRWTKWKKRFENFLLAMNIEDETRKRALLLHYIGPSAFDIFETLNDTGDEKDYKTAMDRLSTLRHNATSITKHMFFVKLANTPTRRSINLPLVCANWPQLATLPLWKKKSNRRSSSTAPRLVFVDTHFVNHP